MQPDQAVDSEHWCEKEVDIGEQPSIGKKKKMMKGVTYENENVRRKTEEIQINFEILSMTYKSSSSSSFYIKKLLLLLYCTHIFIIIIFF